MQTDEYIERYPRLFHMAEQGSWSSIQRHGLLSTTALLDLYKVTGPRRLELESARRPEMSEVTDAQLGLATIRDNKPLREQHLYVDGMTPRQWYELLNRKVFLWVDPERLQTFLRALPYRELGHDMLTVDTAKLLNRQLDSITLAPINTGSTLYPNAPRRGAGTFIPIADYDWNAMRRRRGRASAVVELTVDYAVPDIEAVASTVQRLAADGSSRTLWP